MLLSIAYIYEHKKWTVTEASKYDSRLKIDFTHKIRFSQNFKIRLSVLSVTTATYQISHWVDNSSNRHLSKNKCLIFDVEIIIFSCQNL